MISLRIQRAKAVLLQNQDPVGIKSAVGILPQKAYLIQGKEKEKGREKRKAKEAKDLEADPTIKIIIKII